MSQEQIEKTIENESKDIEELESSESEEDIEE